jgi:hypothetical protein
MAHVVALQDLRVYAPRLALVAERMVSAVLVRLVVQDASPRLDYARSLRLHKFVRRLLRALRHLLS